MRTTVLAICLLALPACGGAAGDNQTAVGGVSQGEADALNDAAEMLDSEQANANALPQPSS